MDRNDLLYQLSSYQTKFHEEMLFISSFMDLVRKYDNCFNREERSAHITGSAWVLNTNFNKVLLVKHKKLDRWLQPGGHADGDENLIRVARKELEEETGVTKARIFSESIFDLDIHKIPASMSVSLHYHFDVRYLFVAHETSKLVTSKESRDIRWWALEEVRDLVNNDRSIMRMVDKSGTLSNLIEDQRK